MCGDLTYTQKDGFAEYTNDAVTWLPTDDYDSWITRLGYNQMLWLMDGEPGSFGIQAWAQKADSALLKYLVAVDGEESMTFIYVADAASLMALRLALAPLSGAYFVTLAKLMRSGEIDHI